MLIIVRQLIALDDFLQLNGFATQGTENLHIKTIVGLLIYNHQIVFITLQVTVDNIFGFFNIILYGATNMRDNIICGK